jgi:hypothetical protein
MLSKSSALTVSSNALVENDVLSSVVIDTIKAANVRRNIIAERLILVIIFKSGNAYFLMFCNDELLYCSQRSVKAMTLVRNLNKQIYNNVKM